MGEDSVRMGEDGVCMGEDSVRMGEDGVCMGEDGVHMGEGGTKHQQRVAVQASRIRIPSPVHLL
eukprot:166765-Chlamydomonas_euryale.AAC.1